MLTDISSLASPAAEASSYSFPATPVRTRAAVYGLDHAAGRARTAEQCAACPLRQRFCVASCFEESELGQLDPVIHTWRNVRRTERLFRAGDPFHSVYAVRSGSFKTVVIHPSGRDHVSGFHLTGETLGLDGICSGRHCSDAVALEDSTVCVIPFQALEALCREVRSLQQYVHRLLSAEIVRESGLMAMLAGMTAEQRLAGFLLNIATRMEARGYSGVEFCLRMTRADIGNYLGVTVETVSRTFSLFQQNGLISVQGKHVMLRDKDGLDRL